MPSPFPGMDPWLENPSRWAGVHTALIVAIQTQLNQTLPGDLVADIDEYLWLADSDDEKQLLGKPDAFIPDQPEITTRTQDNGTAVLARSMVVSLPNGPPRKQRYVKIMTVDGRTVLTVIEIPSPSNKKPGSDRAAYLSKRREFFAARTNLVEIDLLRDGDRIPMGRPRPPVTDYYLLVSTAENYPSARVWPFSVQETIPRIPIPLRPGIPWGILDLRPCLDAVYDGGAFDRKVNYTATPTPPLRPVDADWASELLKKHPHKCK